MAVANTMEMELARLMRRRGAGIASEGAMRKERVVDASLAGSALEADKLAARMGQAGSGLRGGIEGALTAGIAEGLDSRSANIDRQTQEAIEGPGKQLLIEDFQRKKKEPIEKKIRQQQEAGTAITTGAQVIGSALQGLGTLTNNPGLQGAGMLTSGLGGGAGALISGTAMTESDRDFFKDLDKAAKKTAAKDYSYQSMLGRPTSYKGFELKPGGGFNTRRRQRFNLFDEENDIFGA
jgi:hypothetical protein